LNFPFFIARRYLFSRSNRNAVNIITGISVLAITVVAMAMVMVLSAFNGMEALIYSFTDNFDPDVKIVSAESKFMKWNDQLDTKIRSQAGVEVFSRVLEERALIKSEDRSLIISLKGVDSNFIHVSDLGKHLTTGDFFQSDKETAKIILGLGIANRLQLAAGDFMQLPEIWIPKVSKKTYLDPRKAFHRQKFFLEGTFLTGHEYDHEYGICDLSFAERLMEKDSMLSAIEIKLSDEADEDKVISNLQASLGADFKVLSRLKQHPEISSFIQVERLMINLIFILILLISVFNMIGSLTLLIIEKQANLNTLHAMGASLAKVKAIFGYEALLINGYGAIIGLGLGLLVCYFQMNFEYITMPTNAGAIPYPVKVRWLDLVLIFSMVLSLGSITSYFAIRKIKLS